MKIQNRIAAFTTATLILGVLLSTQFQAQNTAERELYQQRPENLIAMVKNLSDKRQKLNQEMSDLSDQLYDRRNAFEDEALVRQSLEQELAKLEIVNGSRPVEGEGLEVTFLATSFVNYTHVISLVNELWASGAEAIAVSDMRIQANSSIFFKEGDQGLEITVNGKAVSWPLKVTAIGNANNLEKGLTLPGGYIDLMAYNNIHPTLRQKELVSLPAVKTQPTFIYLKEYTGPAASKGTNQAANQTANQAANQTANPVANQASNQAANPAANQSLNPAANQAAG